MHNKFVLLGEKKALKLVWSTLLMFEKIFQLSSTSYRLLNACVRDKS